MLIIPTSAEFSIVSFRRRILWLPLCTAGPLLAKCDGDGAVIKPGRCQAISQTPLSGTFSSPLSKARSKIYHRTTVTYLIQMGNNVVQSNAFSFSTQETRSLSLYGVRHRYLKSIVIRRSYVRYYWWSVSGYCLITRCQVHWFVCCP